MVLNKSKAAISNDIRMSFKNCFKRFLTYLFFQLENSKKSRTDHHDSSEELEKLREEVAALRERQSAFEELESRVKLYEAISVEPAQSQQRYAEKFNILQYIR